MEESPKQRSPPQPHVPLHPSTYPGVYPDPRLTLTPEAARGSSSSNYFMQQDRMSNSGCNGYTNGNGKTDPLGLCNKNNVGTLQYENGIINLNVPMAYSYPYDPKPAKSKKHHKHKNKSHKPKACPCPQPQEPVTIRLKFSKACNNAAPFCSTVRSDLCGPPSKGYIAKDLPPCGNPPRGQNKTKMKWDFDPDCKIPVQGVEYGEELYQLASRNFAIQSQLDQMKNIQSGRSSSSRFSDDNCTDFSTPAFNSSLKTSKELTAALEGLKNLPIEIERMFKADKRFEPIILDKAAKALNIKSKSKVFKDLVPVEPNNDIVDQLSKAMLEEVQSVRPLPRSRDPEPSLLDFQEPSFSRMKPKAVLPPTKPTSGVSTELPHSHHIIESENKFQEDANKM